MRFLMFSCATSVFAVECGGPSPSAIRNVGDPNAIAPLEHGYKHHLYHQLYLPSIDLES